MCQQFLSSMNTLFLSLVKPLLINFSDFIANLLDPSTPSECQGEAKPLLVDSGDSETATNEDFSTSSESEIILTPRAAKSEEKISRKGILTRKHSSAFELGTVLRKDSETYRLSRTYYYKDLYAGKKHGLKYEIEPLIKVDKMPRTGSPKVKESCRKHLKESNISPCLETDVDRWDNSGNEKRVWFSPRSDAYYYHVNNLECDVSPLMQTSYISGEAADPGTESRGSNGGITNGRLLQENRRHQRFVESNPRTDRTHNENGPWGANSMHSQRFAKMNNAVVQHVCIVPDQQPMARLAEGESYRWYTNDGEAQGHGRPKQAHYVHAPNSYSEGRKYYDGTRRYEQNNECNNGARLHENTYPYFEGPRNDDHFYRHGNDQRSNVPTYQYDGVPMSREQNVNYRPNQGRPITRGDSVHMNGRMRPNEGSCDYFTSARGNAPNMHDVYSPRAQRAMQILPCYYSSSSPPRQGSPSCYGSSPDSSTLPRWPQSNLAHTLHSRWPPSDLAHATAQRCPPSDLAQTPDPRWPPSDLAHATAQSCPPSDLAQTPDPRWPPSDLAQTSDPRWLPTDLAHTLNSRWPPSDLAHASAQRCPPTDLAQVPAPRCPQSDLAQTPDPRWPPSDLAHASAQRCPPTDLAQVPAPRCPPSDLTQTPDPRWPPSDLAHAPDPRCPPSDLAHAQSTSRPSVEHQPTHNMAASTQNEASQNTDVVEEPPSNRSESWSEDVPFGTPWRRDPIKLLAKHPRVYDDRSPERSRRLQSTRKRSLKSVLVRDTYGDTSETEQDDNRRECPPRQTCQTYQTRSVIVNDVHSTFVPSESSSEDLQRLDNSTESEYRNCGRRCLEWPTNKKRTVSWECVQKHENTDVITDPRWTFSRTKIRPTFTNSFELLCRNDGMNKGIDPRWSLDEQKSKGFTNSYEMLAVHKTSNRSKSKKASEHRKTKDYESGRREPRGKQKPNKTSKMYTNNFVVANVQHQDSGNFAKQLRSKSLKNWSNPCNDLRDLDEYRPLDECGSCPRGVTRLVDPSQGSQEKTLLTDDDDKNEMLFECGKSEYSPRMGRNKTSQRQSNECRREYNNVSGKSACLPNDVSSPINGHKYSEGLKHLSTYTYVSASASKQRQPAMESDINCDVANIERPCDDDADSYLDALPRGRLLTSKVARHQCARGADNESIGLERCHMQNELSSRCTVGDAGEDVVIQVGFAVGAQYSRAGSGKCPGKMSLDDCLKYENKTVKHAPNQRFQKKPALGPIPCVQEGVSKQGSAAKEETSSESEKLRQSFKKIPSRRSKCVMTDFSVDSVHALPKFVQVIPAACSSEEKQITNRQSPELHPRCGNCKQLVTELTNKDLQEVERGNLTMTQDDNQLALAKSRSKRDSNISEGLSKKMNSVRLSAGDSGLRVNNEYLDTAVTTENKCQMFRDKPNVVQEDPLFQKSISSGYKSLDDSTESREELPNALTPFSNFKDGKPSSQEVSKLLPRDVLPTSNDGDTKLLNYLIKAPDYSVSRLDGLDEKLSSKKDVDYTIYCLDCASNILNQPKLKAVRKSQEDLTVMPESRPGGLGPMKVDVAEIGVQVNAKPLFEPSLRSATITVREESEIERGYSSRSYELAVESEEDNSVSPDVSVSSSLWLGRTERLVARGEQMMHSKLTKFLETGHSEILTVIERDDRFVGRYDRSQNKTSKMFADNYNEAKNSSPKHILTTPLQANNRNFEMQHIDSDVDNPELELPIDMYAESDISVYSSDSLDATRDSCSLRQDVVQTTFAQQQDLPPAFNIVRGNRSLSTVLEESESSVTSSSPSETSMRVNSSASQEILRTRIIPRNPESPCNFISNTTRKPLSTVYEESDRSVLSARSLVSQSMGDNIIKQDIHQATHARPCPKNQLFSYSSPSNAMQKSNPSGQQYQAHSSPAVENSYGCFQKLTSHSFKNPKRVTFATDTVPCLRESLETERGSYPNETEAQYRMQGAVPRYCPTPSSEVIDESKLVAHDHNNLDVFTQHNRAARGSRASSSNRAIHKSLSTEANMSNTESAENVSYMESTSRNTHIDTSSSDDNNGVKSWNGSRRHVGETHAHSPARGKGREKTKWYKKILKRIKKGSPKVNGKNEDCESAKESSSNSTITSFLEK